jgi:hypothetical protein
MKIWFRIGAEQGNGQDGSHPPERYRSAHSKARAIDFLRRGAVCCARFSVSDQRHPLADTRSLAAVPSPRKFQARSASPKTFPTPEKRRELPHFSGISNRFWPKNRSYRKQMIKPCLTGARTAISDLRLLHPGWFSGTRFSRDFASKLSRIGMLSREPLFESRMLQRGVQFSDKSNRNWPANRSYRKQKTKPFLTETRIAHSGFCFLALFMCNLDASNRERRPLNYTFLFHPRAARRGVPVRRSSCWTCAILAGEIATNGLHRTYPE